MISLPSMTSRPTPGVSRRASRRYRLLPWVGAALILMGGAGCGSLDGDRSLSSAQTLDLDDDKDDGLLPGLTPSNFRKQLLKATGQGPNPAVAKQRFQEAEEVFAEASRARQAESGERSREADRLFESAAKVYISAAERWPDSSLEENSLFMAGECYFFLDMYSHANDLYERLIARYPQTRHLDTAERRRYNIAAYWLKSYWNDPQRFYEFNLTDRSLPYRDLFGEAVRIFDKIRIEDPTGDLADDATLAAANAYFRKGDFFRADSLYADLRSAFPSSEHQLAAHLFGLKAKLNTYPGPKYPSEILKDAAQIHRQLTRQFRHELGDHREEVERLGREVRYKQAEYAWQLAAYFDHRHHYRAARQYYQEVLSDFDDTPFAERAEERLAAIREEPDVPPQRLSWLVDLFPEADPAKPLLVPSSSGGTVVR